MIEQYDAPIGVIIGDIVDSTKLEPNEFQQVLDQTNEVQKFIGSELPANSHSVSRGDEFQSVILNYEQTLRYAILYRVAIKALGKKFDCRISFAVARNAQLRETVAESMGLAFTLSGRGLSKMKSERFIYHSDSTYHQDRMALLISYLDRQIEDLTSRQCEIIMPLIKNFGKISYTELAEDLQISNATVSKALKSSGWVLIEGLIIEFQNTIAGSYND